MYAWNGSTQQPKRNTTAPRSGTVAPKTQAAAMAVRLIVPLSSDRTCCNSGTRNGAASQSVPSRPNAADVHPFRHAVLLGPCDIHILSDDGCGEATVRVAR